jgi:hypothetical protein
MLSSLCSDCSFLFEKFCNSRWTSANTFDTRFELDRFRRCGFDVWLHFGENSWGWSRDGFDVSKAERLDQLPFDFWLFFCVAELAAVETVAFELGTGCKMLRLGLGISQAIGTKLARNNFFFLVCVAASR